MKKLSVCFIVFIMILSVYSGVNAQCTVSSHSQPGFYPTSQTGIHPAAATQLYDLNITIVVPSDTIIPPLPSPVPIDSIRVQSFIGFPAGFQYYYNTISGWINGGTAGCMRIFGTPAASDVGIHSISIVYHAMVGGFAIPDTLSGYWQFEIKDDAHVSVESNGELAGEINIFPNPANDVLNVSISASGLSMVSIFNSSGRLVSQFEADAGSERLLTIETDGLKPGLYFISINQQNSFATGKFLVTR